MVKNISQIPGYFWLQELNKTWCRAKIQLKCFHKTELLIFGLLSSWQRIILPWNRKTGWRVKRKSNKEREKGGYGHQGWGGKAECIQCLASLTVALQQLSCSFCKPLVMKGACSWQCIQRGLSSFHCAFVCPLGYSLRTLILSAFRESCFIARIWEAFAAPAPKQIGGEYHLIGQPLHTTSPQKLLPPFALGTRRNVFPKCCCLPRDCQSWPLLP